MIVCSALMIWKGLIVVTGSESPIVVVLSGSMEPAFFRGDLLFLTNFRDEPIRVGDIIVFRIEGREIPIVHRVIKVHEKEDGSIKFLTKGDNNSVDDRGLYAQNQYWLERKDVIGRLNRVDEVHNLIKRLVDNPKDCDLIDKDVDKYLSNSQNKTTAFNKTVINSSPSSSSTTEGFLKELERDANERATRKAKSKAKADEIKKKANDYFNANDFVKAISYYTRAINECKDYDILYTNRAQAYLKIEKTQEALADCEMAILISPKNHKAYLHKGRSLVRLNRFDEALESYNKVLEIAPQLKKYMEEFFSESRALKEHLEAKTSAENAFNTNQATGSELFTVTLAKLTGSSEQRLEFFVGGLEMVLRLCDQQTGNVDRLQSDLKSGQGIFTPGCQLRRELLSIVSRTPNESSEMQMALVAAWLELLSRLVGEDDSMIQVLFAPTITDSVSPTPGACGTHHCLEQCCRLAAHQRASSHLMFAALKLLLRLSTNEVGLQQIFDRVATSDLLALTMRAARFEKQPQLVSKAMALFENLARSHRFKVTLGKSEQLVQPLIDCVHAALLASVGRSDTTGQLNAVVSIVELLADNSSIRARLIRHDGLLDVCLKAIEARLPLVYDDKHASALLQLFSMVHNLLARARLTAPLPDRVRALCVRVVASASFLVSQPHDTQMRSVLIQVLAQMLPVLTDDQLTAWCLPVGNPDVSVPAGFTTSRQSDTDHRCPDNDGDDDSVSMCRSLSRQSSLTDIGYLDKVCRPLRLCVTVLDASPRHPLLPDAIKILALASRVSQAVRFLCCDVRERAVRLQTILCEDLPNKLDESMCGNVCLLFMQCVAETPLAEHLVDTGIIKSLLRICADANKPDCRRNAAIFAGKLAQSNHVHRAEMSRLNGFSIVSKFNDWR